MKEQGFPCEVAETSSRAVEGMLEPCRNRDKLLPSLHFPSSVGSRRQHTSSEWCRSCIAAFINGQIEANDYKHVGCPIEGATPI